ncbi:vWA domain-containing protein [Glycomyces harbinensis]|uniref:Ca-activated chloride channel family protein n=1 Tax=Glycomyces harbinensis TaxID=58114 RepID=A0A1G6TSY5_9ACTN|nr:von Willebrand factor type A domain-containing protein [Glycomyces harbinensis]SDD32272.1 Ca-activated chloride channel family protein [Glycomyces harbinensis]
MRRLWSATIPAALLLTAFTACSGSGSDGGSDTAVSDYAGEEALEASPGAADVDYGETYDFNETVDPAEDPESTFAVDVDTASYDFARRSLEDGELPPADQVRPEEFVNYFDPGYTEPEGNGFAVYTESAPLPEWYSSGDATQMMRVGLQTRSEPDSERADVNLTFVIDVSGSMEEDDRIGVVRESLHTLIDGLRPDDAVAIVTYESESDVLQEMTEVGDGEELHDAVDDLEAGGSTNMLAGLEDGYELAGEAYDDDKDNRVILLSDGEANVGLTEHDEMLEDLGEDIAEGTTLLTVGVGDSYNQQLLEQLADNGDGWAVYFATESEAERVFSERLTSTLGVTARDAKIQVTFDPEYVAEYRLIGFENRAIEDEEFEDDSVDGGEVGPGHSVTALYALTLKEDTGDGAVVDVRWQDPETEEIGTASAVLDTGAVTDPANRTFEVAVVAAAFAELLRGSAEFDVEELLPAARDLAETTEDPDVDELAELIGIASDLGLGA